VTDQECQTRPDELTDAIDRALMAGLRLLQPVGDQAWYEVVCPVCWVTLSVPMRPLSPELAAWRLDAFTARHIRHGVPPADGPVCRMCGVERQHFPASEGSLLDGVKPRVVDPADTILTPRGRGWR
jgi:hypothetical protein